MRHSEQSGNNDEMGCEGLELPHIVRVCMDRNCEGKNAVKRENS